MSKIRETLETQLLKLGSILMIFSSMVRFFFGMMFCNFATLSLVMGSITKQRARLFNVTSILIFAGAALEMVVGIIGTLNCEEPSGAKRCIGWGIATLIWTTVCNFLQIYLGYGASYVAWITGAGVPGLFLLGAILFCSYSKRRREALHALYPNL